MTDKSVKNWLSKQDFEKMDELFGKLGYGGYYDFLECLKLIAGRFGARDLYNIKTIPEMMAILLSLEKDGG